MKTIGIAIVGIAGRMGRRLFRLGKLTEGIEVRVGLERPGVTGHDFPHDLQLTQEPGVAASMCDVVVDFSAPAAAEVIVGECVDHGTAYLCASTALEDTDLNALRVASASIPVLVSANLSLGIALLRQLAERASRSLANFDVEIFELHHRHKRDAPSGTALALGEALRRGNTGLVDERRRSTLQESRDEGSLGYAALRGGDVAGEHTIFFLGDGERLELTHRSHDPDIFAQGALRAAAWLAFRQAGYYRIDDVVREP